MLVSKFDEIAAVATRLREEEYGAMIKRAYAVAHDLGAVRLNETSNIVFTDRPKVVCGAVVNMLFTEFHELAMLKTNCEGVLYTANLRLATMVNVWHTDIMQFLKPRVRDLGFLAPRAYMILTYRDLYNPAKIEDYPSNFKQLKTLNKIKLSITTISSDTAISGEATGSLRVGVLEGDHDVRFFKCMKDEVHVGIKAFHYFIAEPMESLPYEIISANVPSTINKLRAQFPKIKVEEQAMPILNDMWFKRYKIQRGKKILCYIYNAAEYDLIPFIHADVRIGTLFVVARFVLINVWFLKLQRMNLDKAISSMPKEQLKAIIYYYYEIHDRLIGLLHASTTLVSSSRDTTPVSAWLVPPLDENYYGFNIDERYMLKQCKGGQDYRPYIIKKIKGHLLKFT